MRRRSSRRRHERCGVHRQEPRGGRKAGLGVAFTEPDSPARCYIERQLAGLKAGERPTYTL